MVVKSLVCGCRGGGTLVVVAVVVLFTSGGWSEVREDWSEGESERIYVG